MNREQLKAAKRLLDDLEQAEKFLRKWDTVGQRGLIEQTQDVVVSVPVKLGVPATEDGVFLKLPYTFIRDCLADEVAKVKAQLVKLDIRA